MSEFEAISKRPKGEQLVTRASPWGGLTESQEAPTVYGRVTDGAVSRAPEEPDR
ncbi:hypothetical protein Ahu01nite_090320 [Winogradskya humida]|uniref:Uncharacterized protein n=1 Tax=Winogradskya humida TaxID=113566 RepID=A0ABQ4A503_9ACTN|nr:hypothetical protein Ahu01nite_090320 [Actinoplanes humidus]